MSRPAQVLQQARRAAPGLIVYPFTSPGGKPLVGVALPGGGVLSIRPSTGEYWGTHDVVKECADTSDPRWVETVVQAAVQKRS